MKFRMLFSDKKTFRKVKELSTQGADMMNALPRKAQLKLMREVMDAVVALMEENPVTLPEDRETQLKWYAAVTGSIQDCQDMIREQEAKNGVMNQEMMRIQPALVEMLGMLSEKFGIVRPMTKDEEREELERIARGIEE